MGNGDFKFGPIQVLDKNLSLRGIFAWDGDVVWVSGSRGGVYRTSDGGKRWNKVNVPGGENLDFRDIHMLNRKTIILMSAGPGDKSRIFKSADNGNSWQTRFINPHENGFLNSIQFVTAKIAYAVGDPLESRLYILASRDGGDSWQELPMTQRPETLNGEAGFAASGTCIALYRDMIWIGGGGPKARIFKSADKGKTWQVFDTPILYGKNSSGIFSVHFKDAENGMVVGGDYQEESATLKTAALTYDGGKTWRLVGSKSLPFQSCVEVISRQGKGGYVTTGPAGTFVTETGVLWNRIGQQGFHSLSVTSKGDIVWLAGSKGRVAKLVF